MHKGKGGVKGREVAYRTNGVCGYKKEQTKIEMNVENKSKK